MAGSDITPYQGLKQVAFPFWAKPVLQNLDGTYYVPGFEGEAFATNPWDYIKVAVSYGPPVAGATPDRTPGVCRIRLRKEYSVDKKKPAGAHGTRVTFHGVNAAEFDIEITIWTPEQLRQLGLLWADLFPPANKGSPVAFDVQHPLLHFHGVKSLQFMAGEGPDIQPNRTAVFRIRAVEFLPPVDKKNATKTESGSIGSLLDEGAYGAPSTNRENLGPL